MWAHIQETSKSVLLALCEGNSPVTSNVEKASMRWHLHVTWHFHTECRQTKTTRLLIQTNNGRNKNLYPGSGFLLDIIFCRLSCRVMLHACQQSASLICLTTLSCQQFHTVWAMNRKTFLSGTEIPITKIRQSWIHLIFILGIPTLRWWPFYSEIDPFTGISCQRIISNFYSLVFNP